jgi:hypothetical protein
MRTPYLRTRIASFRRTIFLAVLLGCICTSVMAHTNSWISPLSGNWEDLHWSLGILPAPDQTILITNGGFKAVQIWQGTVQNHPETLNIAGLIITSPPGSQNTLLMNFAGVLHPLVIGGGDLLGFLIINPNATFTMLSSALQVRNAINGTTTQGAFSIGGTFNATDSLVAAGFMNLGDVGPGVFNATNTLVNIGVENMSSLPAAFHQQGGSNIVTTLNLAGEYDLYAGFFSGAINLRGGTFHEFGGAASATLAYTFGSYILGGGILTTPDLTIPIPPSAGNEHTGSFLQNGGTNFTGAISIGSLGPSSIGEGSYVLSNGVLFATGSLTLGPPGSFAQWGGLQTNNGINVEGSLDRFGAAQPSSFVLGAGTVFTPFINVGIATFAQSGGSNFVSGAVTLSGAASNVFKLSGGRLADLNTTVFGSTNGGFFQSGGVHVVTNLLTITGQVPGFAGYVLSGGQLIVSNMLVAGGTAFHHTGGTLSQSGLITVAGGTVDEQTAVQTFGPLQLSAGNSSLLMRTNGASILHFADSHTLVWSNSAMLTIENWKGSPTGGGAQQVIFGNSAGALTTQQLSQIKFHNPDGIPGTFPARILSTGEIVPDQLMMWSMINHQLVIQWSSGWTLQSATNAPGPFNDVAGATSPYTNHFTGPKVFYRLRK